MAGWLFSMTISEAAEKLSYKKAQKYINVWRGGWRSASQLKRRRVAAEGVAQQAKAVIPGAAAGSAALSGVSKHAAAASGAVAAANANG